MEDSSVEKPSKKPSKKRKNDSATDTDDLTTTEVSVSMLESINKKLEVLSLICEEVKGFKVIDSVEAGVCGSHSASSVLSTFPQFLLWALEVSLICWSLDVFGVGEG
ncbi:uncharacterized protein LOC144039856 [Vanacampus margaritifer]